MSLAIVSAGAAQALVRELAREAGLEITGHFGAVGAMLEKLEAGEPADVIVLTRAQIDVLAARAQVLPESAADLGAVPTCVAVRADAQPLEVGSAESLAAALSAADTIHMPDPQRATAGIHFARVLDALGLREALAARLCTYPNGATAMRALAEAPGKPIGCTQATEILATPGVRLVAPLPPGYGLETVYVAVVSAQARDRATATAFVTRLTGAQSRARREAAGFR